MHNCPDCGDECECLPGEVCVDDCTHFTICRHRELEIVEQYEGDDREHDIGGESGSA